MIVWCLVPIPSTLFNDPPPDGSSIWYDLAAQTLGQCLIYGVPYLLGRLYFTDATAIRELAIGFVIASLVYVPFVVYEARMSPQMHRMFYGYAQHDFLQTIRFDGYRPMVFLQHGLALGMFLTCAFLVALTLWLAHRSPGTTAERRGIERYFGSIALLLGVTAIFSKSTGALALAALGLLVLFLTQQTRSRVWLLLVAGLAPLYVTLRTDSLWSGQELVDFTATNINADRAGSLEYRFHHEARLTEHAFRQPIWGWGGWGRNLIHDRSGRNTTTPDGLWVIVFGTRGFVGLISFGLMLLMPVAMFAWRFPPSTWAMRSVTPLTAIMLILPLWSIDSLFNAMQLPAYFLFAGAAISALPRGFPEAFPQTSSPNA